VSAEPGSRYEGVETYAVTDRRGRTVAVVAVPPRPDQARLGIHLMRDGQRLDHLAQRYLGDPTAWWRICELADAMLPESLTEASEVEIPRRGG
jgi:hypothetical protein